MRKVVDVSCNWEPLIRKYPYWGVWGFPMLLRRMSTKIHSKGDLLRKIADRINTKRRKEVIETFIDGQGLYEEFARIKAMGLYNKGNKSKTMRKIASYPLIIDQFFIDIYGPDYYKEKDFFKKYAPEWLVIDAQQL
jgi:uncharacterized protein YaaR (DUF327 family)